ncbi:hypothetical protein ACLB1G_07600 [Oxalobacteraceae bacterium A2-2]
MAQSQRAIQTTHPSKESVRAHLQRRRAEDRPPPGPERIREELGWRLIPSNRSS